MHGSAPHEIEMWADSFHEGTWACDQLAILHKAAGGTHSVAFEHGYIPVHDFGGTGWTARITVYGSYAAWDNRPPAIDALIRWGKPDFVAFDVERQAILFAVEESAATPTGNQALQRCERQFGAANQRVPFWYLLSEYGMHVDGNARRDSIWPTIMGLTLSAAFAVPSVVLHYADLDNPEDYSAGTGLRSLFNGLLAILRNAATGAAPLDGAHDSLRTQYREMLDFTARQWPNQIDFLPSAELLREEGVAAQIAAAATGSGIRSELFTWPLTRDLPPVAREAQVARTLIKDDPLVTLFEGDVRRGVAYGLSGRSGSRPQNEDSVAEWVAAQAALFAVAPRLSPPASFTLSLGDFPESDSGRRHLTTGRRITYLYDRWGDLRMALEAAYPRLRGSLDGTADEEPSIAYVSNSLKPGRVFGDPFTGQIAALAVALGRYGDPPRRMVAYFPHQVHAQVADPVARSTKGAVILGEMTDLVVFHAGVAVDFDAGRII